MGFYIADMKRSRGGIIDWNDFSQIISVYRQSHMVNVLHLSSVAYRNCSFPVSISAAYEGGAAEIPRRRGEKRRSDGLPI
jgi:hypothetical protein